MPPKKAKQGSATIIDGVNTTEMTRENLEQFTMRVKQELDREREERNYFQLERDKIRTFWEITKTQLDELRIDNRNKDKEIEESIEASEAAAKSHAQHVKHLAYEQMGERCALRADAQAALKNLHIEYADREAELLKDKRELQMKLTENEIVWKEEMRRIKLENHEEISKIRADFEKKILEMETLNEQKLQTALIEANMIRQTDLAEVEERKNKQLDNLIRSHETAFSDLKNYYSEITLNNLRLISSLKAQMEETLRLKEHSDKIAADAIADGKKHADPLNEALEEVAELKKQAHYYERDKANLKTTEKILTALKRKNTALQWNYEILLQKYNDLLIERNDLKDRMSKSYLETQQNDSLRRALTG